jgi:DNA-binding beta-propeller fold protein YncE
MMKRMLLSAAVMTAFSANVAAEWQWSLLPGKEKGRKIPAIEYKVAEINSFSKVLKEWEPTTNVGAKLCSPEIKNLPIIEEFPAGKQKVFPKPGQKLVYSVSSNRGHQSRPSDEMPTAKSTTITVMDSETKEVVAKHELPIEFNGGIHDTIMSPDGRYIFNAGPMIGDFRAIRGGDKEKAAMMASFAESNMEGEFYALASNTQHKVGQTTIVKIDALTLEPVALIDFVGSAHHGSGLGRFHENPNMMWIDVFQEDPDGAAVVFFDANTLEVECAIKNESFGKGVFFTQGHGTPQSNKYIVQVTPVEPYVSAASVGMGDPMYLPPNFNGVIDIDTWTLEREVPTPPQVGGFTITDNEEKYLYNVSGGTDQAFKQDFKTGELIWSARTGLGPYGITLSKDQTEVWVADKGESVEYWGHSLTVINDKTGQIKTRIQLPGYGVDHVILAPNGKEIWATSNAWGQIYIVDMETYKVVKTIDGYGRGSLHGAVWVQFDENLKSTVLQDSHDYIERTPLLDKDFRSKPVNKAMVSASILAQDYPSNPLKAGQALFQTFDGCQMCHGKNGEGLIGPNIQGKGFDSVKSAITTKRDMVNWQNSRKLTDRELQAIGMWLESIKPM